MKNNYTFIGMAAAGKTTFGKRISKKLDYAFLDIDKLMEIKEGKKLPKLIKEIGNEDFLRLEEKYILELKKLSKTIISPGGSVIYLDKAMKKLKKISKIILINTDKEIIRKRIEKRIKKGNNSIVGLKEKGFDKLYEERLKLYKKYADIEIKNFDELEKVFLRK